MKAIVRDAYGSVDVLRLGEEANKPVAGEGEVLVRVDTVGVDQGVWHLMAGMPYVMRVAGFGLRAPKNPLLGYDLAGRVEAVGANVILDEGPDATPRFGGVLCALRERTSVASRELGSGSQSGLFARPAACLTPTRRSARSLQRLLPLRTAFWRAFTPARHSCSQPPGSSPPGLGQCPGMTLERSGFCVGTAAISGGDRDA